MVNARGCLQILLAPVPGVVERRLRRMKCDIAFTLQITM
jgi:hypothetical protein